MHLYLGLTAKATQRDLASFVLDAKNALLPLNRSDITSCYLLLDSVVGIASLRIVWPPSTPPPERLRHIPRGGIF
jgi:hypothetical protein